MKGLRIEMKRIELDNGKRFVSDCNCCVEGLCECCSVFPNRHTFAGGCRDELIIRGLNIVKEMTDELEYVKRERDAATEAFTDYVLNGSNNRADYCANAKDCKMVDARGWCTADVSGCIGFKPEVNADD